MENITHTRTHTPLSRFQTIDYQEIQYSTTIINNKLDSTSIDDQHSYLLTADSTFVDNNPNLKYYLMLMNSNTLHNNSILPLILTNNSNCNICIPSNIMIGTSERITSNNYHINEITFDNNTKPQHVTTSHIPIQKWSIIKITLSSNKPQDVTTSDTHTSNNHAITTNLSDKMQNVTNLNATTQKVYTAINPLITPQETTRRDAKHLPCPQKGL